MGKSYFLIPYKEDTFEKNNDFSQQHSYKTIPREVKLFYLDNPIPICKVTFFFQSYTLTKGILNRTDIVLGEAPDLRVFIILKFMLTH